MIHTPGPPFEPATPPQRLFKNDMIPHGWLPVSRYKEIEEDFDACYQPDEEVGDLSYGCDGDAW